MQVTETRTNTMLILDIDNTILPSKLAYEYALDGLKKIWGKVSGGRNKDFGDLYEKARQETKRDLVGHSSNRLRILYFKKMWQIQKTHLSGSDLERILEFEEKYFAYFRDSIKKFHKEHKKEYREVWKSLRMIQKERKIVFLSNENLRTQLQKLSWILPDDLDFQILVSEELGIEKPDPRLFRRALEMGGIQTKSPAHIIGDSWEDDMHGGHSVGLRLIHQEEIFGNPNWRELVAPPQFEFRAWRTRNILTSLDLVSKSSPILD